MDGGASVKGDDRKRTDIWGERRECGKKAGGIKSGKEWWKRYSVPFSTWAPSLLSSYRHHPFLRLSLSPFVLLTFLPSWAGYSCQSSTPRAKTDMKTPTLPPPSIHLCSYRWALHCYTLHCYGVWFQWGYCLKLGNKTKLIAFCIADTWITAYTGIWKSNVLYKDGNSRLCKGKNILKNKDDLLKCIPPLCHLLCT